MNRRQRKKKGKQQITVFIGCDKAAKAEDYRKMKESIEYQLRAGSAVLLPAYLHVEAIIQQPGSRRIVIKQEREAKGMREIVLEIPVEYADGTEEKIYIKAHAGWDLGNGASITTVNAPRILSDKERGEMGI